MKLAFTRFTIITVLVTSLLSFLPNSFVHAQVGTGEEANQNFAGSESGGGSLMIQGVGAAVAGCVVALLKDQVFSFAVEPKDQAELLPATDALDVATSVGTAATAIQSVPVADAEVRVTSEKINTEADKIKEQTIRTKRSGYFDNKKEACLDKAAKNFADRVIDQLTLRTVQWINNGFDSGDFSGNPFYVSNQDNLWKDIQEREFAGLVGIIGYDEDLNPFGKTIIATLLSSIQADIQASFEMNMNAVLAGSTYEQFSADFSVGGWTGWTELFEPQNNIFGSYLLANQVYGQQTAGTYVSAAVNVRDVLNQGMGFLGQQECTYTQFGPVNTATDYYGPDHPLHIDPSSVIVINEIIDIPENVRLELEDQGYSFADEPAYLAAGREAQARSNCTQWKTLTPGTVIREQLNQVVTSPLRKLEAVDEYEENIGLILDSLLNGLIQWGLNGLTCGQAICSSDPEDPSYSVLQDQAEGGTPGYDNYQGIPLIVAIAGNGASFGMSQSQISAAVSSALTLAPANAEMIQDQQEYLDSIQDKLTALYQKRNEVAKLDYCVPGPNPLWYNGAVQSFSNAVNGVTPVSNASFAQDYPDPDDQEDQVRQYYKLKIEQLTGLQVSNASAPTSFQEFQDFVIGVFNGYSTILATTYPLTGSQPSMKQQVFQLFQGLSELNSEINSLEEEEVVMTELIVTLTNLFTSLQQAGLEANLNPDQIQPQITIWESIQDSVVASGTGNILDLETSALTTEVENLESLYEACVDQTDNLDPTVRTPHTLLELYLGTLNANSIYNDFNGQGGNDPHFLPGVQTGNGTDDINLSEFDVQVTNDSDIEQLDVTAGNIY